jgi:hypothetical protein
LARQTSNVIVTPSYSNTLHNTGTIGIGKRREFSVPITLGRLKTETRLVGNKVTKGEVAVCFEVVVLVAVGPFVDVQFYFGNKTLKS